MNVGERIREKRNSLGITQSELAERAVTSRGNINYIEAGIRSPSLELLGRIAAALDTTAVELIKAK